jgi:hypothetical protein
MYTQVVKEYQSLDIINRYELYLINVIYLFNPVMKVSRVGSFGCINVLYDYFVIHVQVLLLF